MQVIVAFLIVAVFAVGAAEFVRATCRRRLAQPIPVRIRAEEAAPRAVIND